MKRLSKWPQLQPTVAFLMIGSILSAIVMVDHAIGYEPPPNSDQPSGSSIPTAARYAPPSNAQQPNGASTTTGVRSCGVGDPELTLLALAPRYDHVGETALTHPTFVWFVPEAGGFLVEFELYEINPPDNDDGPRKLIEASLDSMPGIMIFTLPQSESGVLPRGDYQWLADSRYELGLLPEGRYEWQVTLKCDEDDVSARTVTQAELIVASQVEGSSLEPSSPDPLAEINRYAALGLWYDAFSLASIPSEDSSVQAMKASLLRQLADIEVLSEPPPEPNRLPFSAQLRSIAE